MTNEWDFITILFTKLEEQTTGNSTILQGVTQLMAQIDSIAQKIDDNTAQAQKAYGEIRKALDDLIAANGDVAAAVAAAKAAQKAEDDAGFAAALDTLDAKLVTQQSALQTLDDIVPDAPPPPPTPVP